MESYRMNQPNWKDQYFVSIWMELKECVALNMDFLRRLYTRTNKFTAGNDNKITTENDNNTKSCDVEGMGHSKYFLSF